MNVKHTGDYRHIGKVDRERNCNTGYLLLQQISSPLIISTVNQGGMTIFVQEGFLFLVEAFYH